MPAPSNITEDEAAELARRVEAAAIVAVERARDAYRKDGIPMASWRKGRVVWLDPATGKEVPESDFAKSQ